MASFLSESSTTSSTPLTLRAFVARSRAECSKWTTRPVRAEEAWQWPASCYVRSWGERPQPCNWTTTAAWSFREFDVASQCLKKAIDNCLSFGEETP